MNKWPKVHLFLLNILFQYEICLIMKAKWVVIVNSRSHIMKLLKYFASLSVSLYLFL